MGFTILPLWWRAPWAKAAGAIVFLLLVWQIIRFAEWRSLAARRRLETQVAQRTDELHRANERLAELAVTDELTGLANRRHVIERLTDAFALARRHGTDLSIAMADFDHFKQINDAFGHAAGDRYLVRASAAMRGVLREVDVIGRYGGEEFLLVLPGSSLEGAIAVAERIRSSVEDLALEHASTDFPEGHSTISIGVAVLEPSLKDSSDLLKKADLALYRAKAEGRNRVRIMDHAPSPAAPLAS
jgi:diguanylate cyclase (GGDEF)-like protein